MINNRVVFSKYLQSNIHAHVKHNFKKTIMCKIKYTGRINETRSENSFHAEHGNQTPTFNYGFYKQMNT